MKIPPPGRLIALGAAAGNRSLHLNEMGQGSPAVVLESGIAASSISWSLVQTPAAEFTTVISYDRAGFGWSDRAPHSCTAADAAADLASLLEHAGIRPPHILVGHSFGGLVVRIFQQKYPERVAGLVLVDPVCRADWRDPDESQRRTLARGVSLSARGAMLARAGVVGVALRLLLSGSNRIPKLLARVSAGKGAGVAERLTGEVRKMPRELWPVIAFHWSQERSFLAMADSLRSLPASVRQLDETRALGDLPVIVLSAANSPAHVLAEHDHDARLSTCGEHRIVPGTGHWIQLDAPDAVVAAIKKVTSSAASRCGR